MKNLFGFLKGNNEQAISNEQNMKTKIENHKENITLENIAIAFSCPFRSDFSEGSDLRLFEFGTIEGKNLEKFKKVINRDFDVVDAETLESALEEWEQSALDEENDLETKVFCNSVYLYIITSAVELGYVNISDYEYEIIRSLKEIILNGEVESWKHFGELFVEGDYINTRDFQKESYKRKCEELATKETSPWFVFEWNSVVDFISKLS